MYGQSLAVDTPHVLMANQPSVGRFQIFGRATFSAPVGGILISTGIGGYSNYDNAQDASWICSEIWESMPLGLASAEIIGNYGPVHVLHGDGIWGSSNLGSEGHQVVFADVRGGLSGGTGEFIFPITFQSVPPETEPPTEPEMYQWGRLSVSIVGVSPDRVDGILAASNLIV